MIPHSLHKMNIFEIMVKRSHILSLFSMFFSSFNRKYLKLAKINISVFAFKLFKCISFGFGHVPLPSQFFPVKPGSQRHLCPISSSTQWPETHGLSRQSIKSRKKVDLSSRHSTAHRPIPGVSKKSWHFLIVCQIKTVTNCWKMFLCMDDWRSHLSYDTNKVDNNLRLRWALVMFVKGMNT